MKIVLCLMAAAALAASAGSPASPRDAARLVIDQVLEGDMEGRVVSVMPELLPAGGTVRAWHEEIPVPFEGWLVLVDDMALANWEHPCRWVFVSTSGETLVHRMMTPPMALERMLVEASDLPVAADVDHRQQLLDWFVPNPRPGTDATNCYAWIISGGYDMGNNHVRYYGDVQFLYLTLTQDYGYDNSHIVICFADGLNPAPDQSGGANSNPDLDGNGTQDFDYDATYGGVVQGYNAVMAATGPGDHLFIFTTDHGGSGKGLSNLPPEAYLNLWATQTWTDDSYDTWINAFGTASLHVAMEQCYSGGFLLETVPTSGGQPRTFASAANGSESSWAGNTYPQYDEWAYWWIGAMHGSVPPGGSYPGGALPGNPDLNGDGFVSYGEAADRAELWDAYAQSGQEHPQYDDDPNSCGDLYYLEGLIQTGIEGSSGVVPFTGGLSVSANPLSGSTFVSFTLASACDVDLSVMDLAGRRIATLADGQLQGGTHSIPWDAQVPSGVYIIRFSTPEIAQSLRIVRF